MTLGELADRVREIRESGRRNADAVQVSVSVACFELPLEGVVIRRGKCVLCDGRSVDNLAPVHTQCNKQK